MSRSDFIRLLHEAEGLGVSAVEVTGGEFFCWNSGGAVLKALASTALPVTIVTNACAVPAPALDALAGSHVRLAISIEGPEDFHDSIRGSMAFRRAVKTAQSLSCRSIRFVIATTIMKSSLPHVAWLVELSRNLGAEHIYFGPVQSLNSRSRALEQERLSDDDCIELLAHLSAIRSQHRAFERCSAVNFGMRAFAATHPCSAYACWGDGCHIHRYWPSVFAVRPDGLVLPQSLHINARYAMGNAKRDGLGQVISDYWGGAQHRRFQYLSRYIFRDLIMKSSRSFYFWDELAATASSLPMDHVTHYEVVPHPHDHSAELRVLPAVSASD